MNIVEFLLARIDREQELAQAEVDWMVERNGPDYWTSGDGSYDKTPWEPEIDRDGSLHVSPLHVLVECEARRAIIEVRQMLDAHIRQTGLTNPEEARDARNTRAGVDLALRALALPYADHPDYRREWLA